jgi:hypothetical protein
MTREVKGGALGYHPESGWYSVDRHSVRHAIRDPFRQAELNNAGFRDFAGLESSPYFESIVAAPRYEEMARTYRGAP